MVEAYERLADLVEKTPGFDRKPVNKVEINKLRDEVSKRRRSNLPRPIPLDGVLAVSRAPNEGLEHSPLRWRLGVNDEAGAGCRACMIR